MNITLIKILIKIKNASFLNKHNVRIHKSTFGLCVIKSLYKVGLIQNYILKNKNIIIFLRSIYSITLTKNLKIISTPTFKAFLSYKSLCKFKNTHSVLFFSTTRGLLTLLECKKYKTGGTLLFLC